MPVGVAERKKERMTTKKPKLQVNPYNPPGNTGGKSKIVKTKKIRVKETSLRPDYSAPCQLRGRAGHP